MSVALVVTRGYGNGTLTGNVNSVIVRGFREEAPPAEPNLSVPTSTSITDSSVVLGATTDTANGVAHAVITANGDQSLPTNQEIIDGNAPEELFEAVDLAISATGAFTFAAIEGLSPLTTYGYAIVHANELGNEDAGSRVEGTFVTLVDTTAPNVSAPSASATSDSVILGAFTDEDNGLAHAVITANGDQSLPTNQEIIDGNAPEELFQPADVTISAAGEFTFLRVSGLSSETIYGYAIVHEDLTGNEDSGSRVEGVFTTKGATGAGEALLSNPVSSIIQSVVSPVIS